jgi:hypothetical protein
VGFRHVLCVTAFTCCQSAFFFRRRPAPTCHL